MPRPVVSTWTIDLVYLLHRYGVQQRYFTITRGIDPGYHRQSFYGYGRVLRMVRNDVLKMEGMWFHLAADYCACICRHAWALPLDSVADVTLV